MSSCHCPPNLTISAYGIPFQEAANNVSYEQILALTLILLMIRMLYSVMMLGIMLNLMILKQAPLLIVMTPVRMLLFVT